jgi:putative ATP-dependent endonuclease of OLD family
MVCRVHLARVRLKCFQSFGPEVNTVDLEAMTYLLGHNGAGKTSLLTGLARMFSVDPQQRRVQRSDFHVPFGVDATPERELWVEAEFEFPDLGMDTDDAGVPTFFTHLRIEDELGVARLRIRLTAELDEAGYVDERLEYVLEAEEDGEPVSTARVDGYERRAIQVHYLPARRDPAEHLAHTASTLLGRLLRAVDWRAEEERVAELGAELGESLAGNAAMTQLADRLQEVWGDLHSGPYFTLPALTFPNSDVADLLRHLDVGFLAAPGEDTQVSWRRLSDGQQSLLYVGVVLALYAVGAAVLAGEVATVEAASLRPPSFTLIAVEEPENSLSPHHLGRLLERLAAFTELPDAQAIVATHAPSVVRRVDPRAIRHLRLEEQRTTVVSRIGLPDNQDEEHKFVREAIEAYPELYFARLVLLGEGDSEQVVLPRVLGAHGVGVDLRSISIAPLGGRHVHHFWRLLSSLGIPYLTLLDLDTARHDGGWGRVRYACKQLCEFPGSGRGDEVTDDLITGLPAWDDATISIREHERGTKALEFLEECGVFFTSPLDLDLAMIRAYPAAYGLDGDATTEPDDATLTAVLGKGRANVEQYDEEERGAFDDYRRMFKDGSKPAHHLAALAQLSDEELAADLPECLGRFVERVKSILDGLDS